MEKSNLFENNFKHNANNANSANHPGKNEIQLKNGVLHLQGEMTFRTVPATARHLEQLLTTSLTADAPAKISAISCHGIGRADSAAIALLLFALQVARRLNLTIEIKDVTEVLQNLMDLYGVTDFLIQQPEAP